MAEISSACFAVTCCAVSKITLTAVLYILRFFWSGKQFPGQSMSTVRRGSAGGHSLKRHDDCAHVSRWDLHIAGPLGLSSVTLCAFVILTFSVLTVGLGPVSALLGSGYRVKPCKRCGPNFSLSVPTRAQVQTPHLSNCSCCLRRIGPQGERSTTHIDPEGRKRSHVTG